DRHDFRPLGAEQVVVARLERGKPSGRDEVLARGHGGGTIGEGWPVQSPLALRGRTLGYLPQKLADRPPPAECRLVAMRRLVRRGVLEHAGDVGLGLEERDTLDPVD